MGKYKEENSIHIFERILGKKMLLSVYMASTFRLLPQMWDRSRDFMLGLRSQQLPADYKAIQNHISSEKSFL